MDDDKQRQKVLEQRLTDQLDAQQRSRETASRQKAIYQTACTGYRAAWQRYRELREVTPKRSADYAACADALADVRAAETARDGAKVRWQRAEQHAGSCSPGVAGARRDLVTAGASIEALARAGA